MVLKRIGVLSAAKISGALYGLIGLIMGLIFGLLSLVGAGMATMAEAQGDSMGWLGAFFGLGAIVFMPLFYGAMGFIVGAISAWIFNLASRTMGGLEVDLE